MAVPNFSLFVLWCMAFLLLSKQEVTGALYPNMDDKLDHQRPSLNMTLCTGRCTGDCRSYVTPTSQCYNSGDLFPNDPSWPPNVDVFDTVICQTLVRTIFHSTNRTCSHSDSDDRFQINLDECVGPFGKPRPWGSFSLLKYDDYDDYESEKSC